MHFEYIKNPQSLKIFIPRPGQIDYSRIRWAPVLNCVLQYKNKFLIVQRSAKMNVYPNAWNGIAGYLDDHKNLKEKVWEEMREECGLKHKDIISIRPGTVFDHEAPQYKKTWVIHPVLVKIKTDKIKIDWEAQDYRWVKLNEIKKFKIIPSFGLVVKSLFPKFTFKLK
ncbi:MAG: NUDIX domain-containing protein [Candidatus Parcubacteria bacterium]|nr:NUDIX domain-containing protein [Candidatus Parcubacteria bacterium]